MLHEDAGGPSNKLRAERSVRSTALRFKERCFGPYFLENSFQRGGRISEILIIFYPAEQAITGLLQEELHLVRLILLTFKLKYRGAFNFSF